MRDQTGEALEIRHYPERIISLVPSITELLAFLKLDDQVAGITRFCVEPRHWYRTKKRVGGTKTPHLDTIATLKPDLIIANKEENVREHVELLRSTAPVYVSDVHDIDSACRMIEDISLLTNRVLPGEQLRAAIMKQADECEQRIRPLRPLRAAYLIWQDPVMVAGGGTFINHMMSRAGLINIFGNTDRYPQVSVEELTAENPELVLLSSEPFPFKQSHADAWQALLPESKVILVDGTMFSWYGSRIVRAFKYIAALDMS